MAKTAKGVRPSGKGLYIDGPNLAKRVQTFSSDTDLNEERLEELANKDTAGKTTDLSTSISIEFNNYGSMATIKQALGQGLWDGSANSTEIHTDTDFDNAVVDTVTLMSNDGTTIDFAEWNGYNFLTSFSFSYPADGVATESYDYEGSHNRLFLNDWKNSTVYKADRVNASTAIISGVNLASTNDPILLLVNQNVVASLSDTNDSITLADAASDTNITATNEDGAVSFTAGDRIRLLVSGSGTTFSQLASTPAGIGGLKRGNTRVFLYNPAGNMEETLRIQSLTIDVDLTREELNELGSKRPYDRRLDRPVAVSITAEIFESDLEEFSKLSGNETAFDAGTLREIDLENMLRNNTLELIEYKDEIAQTFANELRRIVITNVSFASDGDSGSVADVVTSRSLNLTAESFLISGSGVTPFL